MHLINLTCNASSSVGFVACMRRYLQTRNLDVGSQFVVCVPEIYGLDKQFYLKSNGSRLFSF